MSEARYPAPIIRNEKLNERAEAVGSTWTRPWTDASHAIMRERECQLGQVSVVRAGPALV